MERYSKSKYIANGEITASYKRIKGHCNAHPHDFFEIEYITAGDGVYNVDGIEYRIKKNMLFLMTPISFHSLTTNGAELYNVMFSEKLCDNEALSMLVLKGSLAIEVREGEEAFFDSILHELCRKDNSAKYSAHLLNALLCKLGSYLENAVDDKPHPVAGGMFYIVSHFRENPNLATVAAYAGFSPTYFSSLFKKVTGVNYKEYLDKLRFDYARKLAENTKLSVMEIAYESGFDDYPNFIRRYKKRFGYSITEMRRNK